MSSEYISWGMRIFDGLNKDVEQLMDNFVKTGSIRYEGFSQIWQDMNFSLVYCGIKSMEQKREFIEEAFRIAAVYLSPPFDFQQRTGGLYLIYAFYSTQRYEPKLKVRLSIQQWEHLKELETEFRHQGHLDAAYIQLKLKAAKAFSFAYSSKQFCFYKEYIQDSSDKMVAEIQRDIEQAFPEGLLRKLHETHHKYQLLKNQLGVAENLDHVTRSMTEVIANRFQDIDDEDEDKNENTSKDIDRCDRLAELKAKSFSFGVEPEKGTSQPTSADETEQGPSSSRIRNLDVKKPSRKPNVGVDPYGDVLVDKLMPVLQQYDLSESEEDEQAVVTVQVEKEKEKKSPKEKKNPSGNKSTKVVTATKKQRRKSVPKVGARKTPKLSPRRNKQSSKKK